MHGKIIEKIAKMKKVVALLVLFLLIFTIQFLSSNQKRTTTTKAEEQVTPNPLPCDDLEHHPERSLLANESFNDFTGGQPNGWTVFVGGDATVNEERGYGIDGPNIRVDGGGNFQAGVYQTVGGLTVGKWYHAFFATAQQMWDTQGCKGENHEPYCGTAIQRDVGADPTGGTDFRSSSIIWGRATGGPSDKEYGIWRTLGNLERPGPLVSFIATSDKATIFLRAKGFDNVGRSNTWIDAAYLAIACQQDVGGGNPTQIPTSEPTVTRTPSIPVSTPIPTVRVEQPTSVPTRPVERPTSIPTQQPTEQPSPTGELPQEIKIVTFNISINNPYKPYRSLKQAIFTVGDKNIIFNSENKIITMIVPIGQTQYKVKALTSDDFTFEKIGTINFDQMNNINLEMGNPIIIFSKNFMEGIFKKVDAVKNFIEILDKPFKSVKF